MAERFDWYQASFPEVHPDEFIGEYLEAHRSASFIPQQPRHGYSHGAVIRAGEIDLLRLLWGGNQGAPLNASASGHQTMPFLKWARGRFPHHSVTRADACIDFESPEAWIVLLDRAIDVKRDHKLSSREQGDWLDGGVKGRTFYLGAPSSDVQFRLYEKGKKEGAGPDWVRAEVQVRPRKLARQACATAQAPEVWGFSRWSAALRERFGCSEVERMAREVVQKQPLEHRFAAMMKQYGKTIAELAARVGTDEELGKVLRTGTFPAEQIGGSDGQ